MADGISQTSDGIEVTGGVLVVVVVGGGRGGRVFFGAGGSQRRTDGTWRVCCRVRDRVALRLEATSRSVFCYRGGATMLVEVRGGVWEGGPRARLDRRATAHMRRRRGRRSGRKLGRRRIRHISPKNGAPSMGSLYRGDEIRSGEEDRGWRTKESIRRVDKECAGEDGGGDRGAGRFEIREAPAGDAGALGSKRPETVDESREDGSRRKSP